MKVRYDTAPTAGVTVSGLSGGELSFDLQYHISSWFGLETGARYIMKGHHSYQEELETSTASLRHYAEFPLLARFQVGGDMKFFIGIGGYIGVLVAKSARESHYSFIEEYVTVDGSVPFSVSDNFFDAGLEASAGFSVLLPEGDFWYMKGRFQYSLTDVYAGVSNSAYQNTFSVLMGIAFKVGR